MGEAHQNSSLDYTLPPSLISRLRLDLETNLNTLVPYRPSNPIATTSSIKHPFFTAMQSIGNATTWNGATAHADTKSALVDLFYELTPGVTPSRLFQLLDKAWDEDHLATVKLIFHARSIHEGKGAEEESFQALAWLWQHHARTFLANLHMLVDPTCKRDRSKVRDEAKAKRLAEQALKRGQVPEDEVMAEEDPIEYPSRPHGTYKDLIDLLILHLHGQLTTNYVGPLYAIDESIAPAHQKHAMKERRLNTAKVDIKRDRSAYKVIAKGINMKHPEYAKLSKEAKKKAKKNPASMPFELQLLHAADKKARHALLGKRLADALARDKKFQALYLTVVNLFAQAIKRDLEKLKLHQAFLTLPEADRKPYGPADSPHLFGMTYAAKWCPSPGKGADRQLHFVEALTKVLFPGRQDHFYGQMLQKEVLTPLRSAQQIPESRMVEGAWKIDYAKVPARSMRRNAGHFRAHDAKGFSDYIRKVTAGRMTISGASMFPHQMLQDALYQTDPMLKQLADLQWKSMVDSVRSSNPLLTNCMAIADVSGSMGCFRYPIQGQGPKPPQPIEVCIALTLLLGELASPPWNGGFFTFSSQPSFETIDPALPLGDKYHSLASAHWGLSTNIAAVFRLILSTARRQKLAPDQMIKKLFVFSDMQFDQASNKQYDETEHQLFVREYAQAGYELPHIAYWNLAAQYDSTQPTSKPVQADTEGVELMSGFSGSLMKHFMGQDVEDGDEDEWEAITGDIEKGLSDLNVKPEGQVKKTKKNPLDLVKKILRADSLGGVTILD